MSQARVLRLEDRWTPFNDLGVWGMIRYTSVLYFQCLFTVPFIVLCTNSGLHFKPEMPQNVVCDLYYIINNLNILIWYRMLTYQELKPGYCDTLHLVFSNTVECRYSAIQYNKILHTALQRWGTNMKKKMKPTKSTSYRALTFVGILEKIIRAKRHRTV